MTDRARPFAAPELPRVDPPHATHEPLDFVPGVALRGSTPARMFDTREHVSRPDVFGVPKERQRPVRDILPPHEHPAQPAHQGEAGPGGATPMISAMLEDDRTVPHSLFPGPFQTEWRPPDPTLGVGDNHIVTTVNMAMAIYDKQGALQYAIPLNNYGSPGLFEPVGASWFTFDPKCFYDHFARRYVVVALETYSSPNSAWVDIAVSDDDNPHGVWHVYRTPVESGSVWWDYPGFGFTNDAWVVTANRIGGSGVGYRVFDKASMLAGGPATYFTLTDPGAGTTQVAHCMTPMATPFAISRAGSTLRLVAITNPTTNPALVATTLTSTITASGLSSIPTPSESLALQAVSGWMMQAAWRDGQLYACSHSTAAGRGAIAWYRIDTGSWPASGAPVLADQGVIDPGPNLHACYPSIMPDASGNVGVVMNVCGPSQNPGVAVTGRLASDPPGMFGRVRVMHVGESSEGGRWGDYSGIAVDPIDQNLLWGIAQYKDHDGWHNWIASFRAQSPTTIAANDDHAGDASTPRVVDVLANDYAPSGTNLIIDEFDATSALGGTITRSIGTGPGGRDQLMYAPAPNSSGQDSFTYRIRATGSDVLATGRILAHAFGSATFFPAQQPGPLTPGAVRVSYYALQSPTEFPDFAQLESYQIGFVASINYGSTLGVFADSGRADDVGAVYHGFLVMPADGVRRFFLSASEGARLYIDDVLVVDCSGPNSSILERSNALGLRAGPHRLHLEYYERYERAGLTLLWTGGQASLAYGPMCDSIDFNRDGLFPDVLDIEDFLSVLAGGTCAPPNPPACNSDIDFNNDLLTPDTGDFNALMRVFAGGDC